MIQGSCLCKAVTITLKGDILYLYNCHCKECRAFSGASFATNACVQAADLQISDPLNKLELYETDGGKRHFCRRCASPIYSHAKGNEEYPALHVGILPSPPPKSLDANIWVSEKCPWVSINESVDSYVKFIE